MTKQVKISYLSFGGAIVSSILHNFIYGLFRFEEPFFFFLALLLFLGFVVTLIYNTITYIKRGEPKDLWKFVFMGLFGLIGLLPNFKPGFFGFFGFFLYFLTYLPRRKRAK